MSRDNLYIWIDENGEWRISKKMPEKEVDAHSAVLTVVFDKTSNELQFFDVQASEWRPVEKDA